MRNATLAIFAANAAGIYAVQVKVNQPVADGLDAEEQAAPPALAEREIGSGLAPLPSPPKAASAPAAVSPARLAAALSHFTPAAHFVPDARMQAPATAPSEPEFAAVVRDAGPEAVRVAAVGPQAVAHGASASFTAAFSGMNAAASTAAADLGGSAMAPQAGPSVPTGAEAVVPDSTASQPPALEAVPQGRGGDELPALDDHARPTGAVPAPAAPAPSPGSADAPNVMLGA